MPSDHSILCSLGPQDVVANLTIHIFCAWFARFTFVVFPCSLLSAMSACCQTLNQARRFCHVCVVRPFQILVFWFVLGSMPSALPCPSLNFCLSHARNACVRRSKNFLLVVDLFFLVFLGFKFLLGPCLVHPKKQKVFKIFHHIKSCGTCIKH